ncbi:arsenite methyltransferase [Natrinema sp. SYSU A 869]|uniref:arsenite methyltransferase n=1 Tax=Natrinema sp. SYSU A 869 TaxID=2871694 RepID=UPI001CA46CA1|nr:arsenite methyltransferase [Natrinema sp. SYSU A 869]
MTDTTPTTDADGDRLSAHEQRTAVRERYGQIATESASCCGETGSCSESPTDTSKKVGYSDDELNAVDGNANLNLGCGNPTAIASLDEGDTVLDLGSGGGFDCFLAAREVGAAGHVIGVDMTPEMIEKARRNIESNAAQNVEFRIGEIEHLPVADESVDVILSNCVINLSPDKLHVFRDAYRVLRPGGRLAISDGVLTTELPTDLQSDPASVAACIGGAVSIPTLETMLSEAGFTDVSIEPKADSDEFIREWDDERDLSDYVVPATIEGAKSGTESHP